MNSQPTLSLGNKLSPETKNKLQGIKGKADKIGKAQPSAKHDSKSSKANNANKAKPTTPSKPKLSQEELGLKKQRAEEHRKAREQAIALYQNHLQHFSKLYPKCFGAEPKPLAIGLHNSLIKNEEPKPEAERISKTAIRKFLGQYTRSITYKECLKAESPRINLQGEEVDKVSPEHAEFARQSVEKWKSRQATRIKNNSLKPQYPARTLPSSS